MKNPYEKQNVLRLIKRLLKLWHPNSREYRRWLTKQILKERAEAEKTRTLAE